MELRTTQPKSWLKFWRWNSLCMLWSNATMGPWNSVQDMIATIHWIIVQNKINVQWLFWWDLKICFYFSKTPVSCRDQSKRCCLCCMVGPISMEATLDRSAYCCGENIKMKCYVENGSDQNVWIICRLIQVRFVCPGFSFAFILHATTKMKYIYFHFKTRVLENPFWVRVSDYRFLINDEISSNNCIGQTVPNWWPVKK